MSHQLVLLQRRAAPTLVPARPALGESGFAEAFSDCLLTEGLIDAGAANRARRVAETAAERFDHVLIKLGLISETDLAAAYAAYCNLPLLTADDMPDRPVVAERLKLAFLKANRVLPVVCTGDRLVLAAVDPFVEDIAQAVSYMLDLSVELALLTPAVMEDWLRRLYGDVDANVEQDVERVAALVAGDAGDLDIDRLRDIANEAPVIRLVNQIIVRAAEGRASDIHIEPGRDAIAIRYRVDGFLRHEQAAPAPLRAALTTRIKIMAKLDIAERRLPQDGRIKTVVRGVEIDIRVATVPTVFGESIVMRILDRSRVELDFDKLGLDMAIKNRLAELMELPNGILLVTGPTGSGKTTTLYTALKQLNRPELKIFTVEDPVEYQLQGVNQIQVQPQIGFDFPGALRSILRQDPDIIMIGEIRDLETARIAIQASLTGHLVFSTLHTNGALAAVTRLVDLGVERFLLASTVSGVMAQRLLRKLCPHCARPHSNPQGLLDRICLAIPDHRQDAALAREAVGCEACSGTGYAGRTMACELFVIDETMREVIGRRNQDQRDMEALARQSGFRSLFEDGVAKVLAGETTFEEVLRVTRVS
ncbi:GspE/PulE family protein [Tardiphaga robiniae]|uniref:Type II/IV secretion system protein n=1 Tax=Tardiphaga robiniae TaxID=943830 RepID=A0A7G6TUM3_9BRAD|nr:GspE/PulE family protein [Tardiphaga robiniae]QND70455.1 type II/IV secretion system protein [Tardiphaga robiniae]